MKKTAKQFIQYLIVGGLATIVEWLIFYVLNSHLKIGYMLATALAYIVSTFSNWGFGRLIMFQDKGNVLKELSQIYLTSIIGLLLNMLIMWILVDNLGVIEMLSKMIATGIVFFWNFAIRKFFIYKI